MKIALIGYGKMGHMLEAIARQRGHSIAVTLDADQPVEHHLDTLRTAEVALEFTAPAAALGNVLACASIGLPVVCGTTGWYGELEKAKAAVEANPKAALFYSANFSIGVYMARKVCELLAHYRAAFPSYEVSIDETHHTAKKDAPSGTAIVLAEQFLVPTAKHGYSSWGLMPSVRKGQLPIAAHREGDVVGIHQVRLQGEFDSLTLTHEAYSREAFALGAVRAAEVLQGKHGVFGMEALFEQPNV